MDTQRQLYTFLVMQLFIFTSDLHKKFLQNFQRPGIALATSVNVHTKVDTAIEPKSMKIDGAVFGK